jgi:drug/metabolite transporter (DMT)-like permease
VRILFGDPGGDRPVAAMMLLLAGISVLALQDSLVKLVAPQTSFWQFQTLRACGNLLVATILALASGGLALLKPRSKGAVYLRALFMTICMFCFFSAAPFLTLTQMAAGLYTYPLFVSLLAGPVLGEAVGPWRIAALAIGALGAAFVLSPWEAGFSPLQLLPVLAGFFYALNILTIRRACRQENTLALAFAVAVAFFVSGIMGSILLSWFPLSGTVQQAAPFVAIGWPLLSLTVIGFAAAASLLNLTGNICMSRAYQTADSSWLAPMDFSYLLFATFWSQVVFDAWPTGNAIIGMLLIASAGALTAWRERRNKKAATEPIPAPSASDSVDPGVAAEPAAHGHRAGLQRQP